jgi:hypothetical protein
MSKFVTEYASTYNENLQNLIGVSPTQEEFAARRIEAESLMNSINTAPQARSKVLEAYGNDASRLYKDLLTVYCSLAATKEAADDKYFSSTFVYVMKHVFNHQNSFSKTINDAVYDLSLFYNLIKSDAFKYRPTAEQPASYIDLGGALPSPSDSKYYTIQFSDTTIMHGGGFDSSYFGGVLNSL